MNLALFWLRLWNVVFGKFNRFISRCQLPGLLNSRLCRYGHCLSDHLSVLQRLLLLFLCFLPLFTSYVRTETTHLLLLSLLFNYLELSQVIRLVVHTLLRMDIRLVLIYVC